MVSYSARLLPILVGALSLAACGQNGTGPLFGPGSTQPNAAAGARGPLNYEGSGISADLQRQDLLYVSNRDDNGVDIYSYPQGKLKGQLPNVKSGGLCSDAEGNVFLTQDREIREYAHGRTRAIAVLHNPLGGVSQFCAVDPTTGDLAVSGGGARNGGVAIYTNAKGSPQVYAGLDGTYGSSAYDNRGNLFVEFAPARGRDAIKLLELGKGETRFREIAWSLTGSSRLGAIQWDGKFLAAESREGSATMTLVRYKISRGQAAVAGRATLTGIGSAAQFLIHGSQIVVASSSRPSTITLHRYPSGDRPTVMITDAGEPQSLAVSLAKKSKFSIVTYHYDNMRTGWNNSESSLTYQSVGSKKFGLLHTVSLDDQVDTQPLVVSDETTTRGVNPGLHDVTYVATESNTVYAIDASSGTVLFQQNLGTPVPLPLGCLNNGPNVGIDGTPVIDLNANVMYVIAYTLQAGTPQYFIHELSLANLTDVVSPVMVTASHLLTDGTTYTFNATVQRQRPALLLSNGNVYAGFGSFCDFGTSLSRGWLLGWQAGSLAPMAANELTDQLATSQNNYFLSAIWMSGYGISADPDGNVYFVTGNSDPSGTSYNSVTNIAETAAKMTPDLTQLLTFFTPSNVAKLDQTDDDFGGGGMLLLPRSVAPVPLAAAAGKPGTMFLMNANSLGGFNTRGRDQVLDEQTIGRCWCGLSYFDATSDSKPRIVASGGTQMTVWKVLSTAEKLSLVALSPTLPSGQDPGFFTTISSDGSKAGAIIWALARPQTVPGNITLLAFKSEATGSSLLQTLFQAPAGAWASGGGNANLVPVVANGQVYVASFQQLDIFGLLHGNAKFAQPAPAKARPINFGAPHQVTGTLVRIRGSHFTLRTRGGALVDVDQSDAIRRDRTNVLVVGRPYNARGTYDASGILHATFVMRANSTPGTWLPDR